ncbi:cobalamin biosynthesis protein CobW [Fulvitalea axinellae]|uniref:Cobalamin biosynthesis protein CobW n=1 Tax=Fulvitalea axinellae TaxID=1182444 RepID=A0AAU9C8X0_9BACT|nr:cobalamin biosynthesis protein CobW [Fulvitalea axinellae]
MRKQAPVTILTGYLGAGKTTLLNRLVEAYPEKKFAVIENEFGDEGIDGELVKAEKGGLYELSNGCVCCDLSSDLVKALGDLMLSDFEYGHVLIEATGVADPAGIVATVSTETHISEFFKIDGVLALVDAEAFDLQLLNDPVAGRQVAFADFVLMNKCADVPAERLESLEKELKEMSPGAGLRRTDFARDVEGLLSLGSGKSRRLTDFLTENSGGHTNARSFSVVLDGSFNPTKLHYWLSGVLAFNDGLYRIKGVLDLAGSDRKAVLQSVMVKYSLVGGGMWKPEEKKTSKVVFIGRELDKEKLVEGLKSCMSD